MASNPLFRKLTPRHVVADSPNRQDCGTPERHVPGEEGRTCGGVVVIGSGAGGGTVAHVLTQLGVNVTLLDSGPMLHPAQDFKEHKTPADYDHRGAGPHGESYTGRKDSAFSARPTATGRSTRALYRRRRQPVPLVPLAHRRRAVRIITAASRCASPTTISSRTRATGWASTGSHRLRRRRAVLRQGRRLHRRVRHERGHPQRAPTATSCPRPCRASTKC